MQQSQQETRVNTSFHSRIRRMGTGDRKIEGVIRRMVELAQRGLPLMFDRQAHEFAFTRKRQGNGQLALQGTSVRYGAIVVLGALHLEEEAQRRIFNGQSATEFTSRLIRRLGPRSNLGDVALVTWAAAELGHPELHQPLGLLRGRDAASCDAYTVEAAWVLSALVACAGQGATSREMEQARDRLLAIASDASRIFPHWTNPQAAPWTRRHVGCFADQVYPIQALARCARATGCARSLAAAARCAEQICHLQGPAGQWWWHYDCRSGQVVEGYPVYTVHQDSMAPMALLDLTEAGGPDFADAIRLGLGWMIEAAEVERSLIDDKQLLIWRKVTRSGPGKLVRQVRAAAARVHPDLRLLWLNGMFRPTAVDYEDRPYHLGWILHAWLSGRQGEAKGN